MTLEERVIAVGKKRNLHLVFYQREMCRIECGRPWKLLVDVVSRVFRTMTTMRRGEPY